MTIDAAEFGKVAVLMGGWSAEREISLLSGQAVLAGLQARDIDAHGIDVDRQILQHLEQEKFDRAFIVVHGRGGEDGVIQAALELMGIPYTGSGMQGSAVGMDKYRSKLIWRGLGLPTPGFKLIRKPGDLADPHQGAPDVVLEDDQREDDHHRHELIEQQVGRGQVEELAEQVEPHQHEQADRHRHGARTADQEQRDVDQAVDDDQIEGRGQPTQAAGFAEEVRQEIRHRRLPRTCAPAAQSALPDASPPRRELEGYQHPGQWL